MLGVITVACNNTGESVTLNVTTSSNISIYCGTVGHRYSIRPTGYYIPEQTKYFSTGTCDLYQPHVPVPVETVTDTPTPGKLLRRVKRLFSINAGSCDNYVLPFVATLERSTCQDSQTATGVSTELSALQATDQYIANVSSLANENQNNIDTLVSTANANAQEVQTKFDDLAGQVAQQYANLQDAVNQQFSSMDAQFMNQQEVALKKVEEFTSTWYASFTSQTRQFQGYLGNMTASVSQQLQWSVNNLTDHLNQTMTTIIAIAQQQNLTNVAVTTYRDTLLTFFREQFSFQQSLLDYLTMKQDAINLGYTPFVNKSSSLMESAEPSNGTDLLFTLDSVQFGWRRYNASLPASIAQAYTSTYECTNRPDLWDVQVIDDSVFCQLKYCQSPENMYAIQNPCLYQVQYDEIRRQCNVTNTASLPKQSHFYTVVMGLVHLPLTYNVAQPVCVIEVNPEPLMPFSLLSLFSAESFGPLTYANTQPRSWYVVNIRTDAPLPLLAFDQPAAANYSYMDMNTFIRMMRASYAPTADSSSSGTFSGHVSSGYSFCSIPAFQLLAQGVQSLELFSNFFRQY